ncbi:g4513 [Coccomyxa elongata]
MKGQQSTGSTTVQHFFLGLGLIFPDKRDELNFLQYIERKSRRRACWLHVVSGFLWLLYLAKTVDLAGSDQKDRWRYALASAFMAFMAMSDFVIVVFAVYCPGWYYWRHEHLKAAVAIGSICTFMEAGILLQSKELPCFSGTMIVLLHAIKLTVDQVRLATAVWLWALQFVALLLVGVGQKVEGTGGSYSPAVAQICFLCSIICLLILGLAVEARIRLEYCRDYERPRGALGSFWESVNLFLLKCKRVMRLGTLKMERIWRYPLPFFHRS